MFSPCDDRPETDNNDTHLTDTDDNDTHLTGLTQTTMTHIYSDTRLTGFVYSCNMFSARDGLVSNLLI